MKNIYILSSFTIIIILGIIGVFYIRDQGEIRETRHLSYEGLDKDVAKVDKGCLLCHSGMQGFAPMHQDIGCISCHKGDNKVKDKDSSHFGMILIPGNFSDMANTCGICHPDAVKNIQTSIMSTNSGLINVDRYIFGERDLTSNLLIFKQ